MGKLKDFFKKKKNQEETESPNEIFTKLKETKLLNSNKMTN